MTVIAVLTAVGWTLSVCAVDIRTLRIPPAVAAGGVAPVVTAGLAGADWTDMAAGATGSTLLYLVLRLVSPSGLGGGDLRLAPTCGALSAVAGPWGWTLGTGGAFLLTGLLAVPVLAVRLLRGRDRAPDGVPHGPGMTLCSAAIGCHALLGGP